MIWSRTSRAAQLRQLGVALAVGAQHPDQVPGEPWGHADLAGEGGRVDGLAGVDLTGEPGVGDPLPRRPRIRRPVLVAVAMVALASWSGIIAGPRPARATRHALWPSGSGRGLGGVGGA